MDTTLVLAIVGTVLASVGIAATIVAARLQRESKTLNLSLLSEVSSDDLKEAVPGAVEFTLDGKPVPGVRVTDILVENRGDRITKAHYGDPITFSFNGHVYDADRLRTIPSGINAEVTYSGSKAQLKPVRLEEGEAVVVRVTSSSGKDTQITAAVDIDGIRQRRFDVTVREAAASSDYGLLYWIRQVSVLVGSAGATVVVFSIWRLFAD